MRWIALDVGSRSVGVAVCDSEERVVVALPPLVFTGAGPLAREVARLVTEREIGGAVVGVPVTRRGQGRGEVRVAAVVDALRQAITVPVVTIDESGTTLEAEQLLAEAGVPRRRWAGLVDGVAARLILEAHLAIRRRRGEGTSQADVDRGGDG